MNRSAPENFAELIDALYAGTLDDTAWDRAILGIADGVRASGALLFAVNPFNREVLRDENHRFDPDVLDDYRRYWVHLDSRLPYFMPAPVGLPVTEQMMPAGAWRHTQFLNEFLLPADVPYFMPVWLHKSPTKYVTLALQGTRKRGPFDEHDIEWYRRLLPHVTRALEIRDRLQCAQVRSDTLGATLDSVSFGVLILDSAGRILETNGFAQELLRTETGLGREPDGTLRLSHPSGRELARWLRSGVPPANNPEGLFHLPRPLGLPLSVLVTPLPARTASWMAGDPRWLLLIFDSERRVHASAELLARDLGISAREAQVVALLVSGLDPGDIASHLRVSVHTVRTQIKSVFGKTGTRSQADLIRRVTLGPSVLERANTPSG